MDRKNFLQLLKENLLILDGATGTELQKRGMPQGVCPELWAIENPDVVVDTQKEYIKAGSNLYINAHWAANKAFEFGLVTDVEITRSRHAFQTGCRENWACCRRYNLWVNLSDPLETCPLKMRSIFLRNR